MWPGMVKKSQTTLWKGYYRAKGDGGGGMAGVAGGIGHAGGAEQIGLG